MQRKTAELFCCAICAGWPVMVQNAIRMQNTSCLATAWVRFDPALSFGISGKRTRRSYPSGNRFSGLPLVFTGEMLASLFGKRKGKHYRSRLLYELSIGNYNRKFQPVRTDYDWLTRDERYVDRFLNNPRCDFIFTVGAYRDFFHEIRAAESGTGGLSAEKYSIPDFGGDKDPVGENGKGREKLAALYGRWGCRCDHEALPGARHEVLTK